MSLFKNLFAKKEDTPAISVQAERNTVYLPIEGEVIPLAQIGDGVFSEGVLGMGCGILPQEETVYAPVSGEITQVAETKHAIGLLSEDGIEVLIHVGMDTVDMNGDGFEVLVRMGQKIRCGQPMLKFSEKKIKAAGHPTTTALVITNSDDYSQVEVLKSGGQAKLSPVLKIK